MGAFSWLFLMDHVGLLWPVVFKGPRWYMVTGIDPRIQGGYPEPISNSGLRVTAEESRYLARIAKNLAEMNDFASKKTPPDNEKNETFGKYIDGVYYHTEEPVFRTFRDDWTDLFRKFSNWALSSSGFTVN